MQIDSANYSFRFACWSEETENKKNCNSVFAQKWIVSCIAVLKHNKHNQVSTPKNDEILALAMFWNLTIFSKDLKREKFVVTDLRVHTLQLSRCNGDSE